MPLVVDIYGQPHQAVNTYRARKVIINLPDGPYAGYRTNCLEQCMYVSSYVSACLQKHSFVSFLAGASYGHLSKACSCHVHDLPLHLLGKSSLKKKLKPTSFSILNVVH